MNRLSFVPIAGIAALVAATAALAGNWQSPWPSYKLYDAHGTTGYHRLYMAWSPFSGGYTTLQNTRLYVNVVDVGHNYSCSYLAYTSPYMSDSQHHTYNADGWHADFYNTPLYDAAYWPPIQVPGLIEEEAGVGSTSEGEDCVWYQEQLALQHAYIGHNSSYVACYDKEQRPYSFWTGWCWQ